MFSRIFSPITINKVEIPNRIVFPAFQVNYADTDGTVSEKLFDFYTSIAAGGCGLVMTGAAVVSEDSVAFDRVMRIDNDNCVSGLGTLFREIEKRGAAPGIQLIHYGRQALNMVTGRDLLAPSAIPCPVMSKFDPNYRVREMTISDIERVRNDFIAAAIRAMEAGARVIEVHAAHGYLLNEFLSPYSNRRDDMYGGSDENRARLIIEIIEGIRRETGDMIAVSLRVSGNEFVEGGLSEADFKKIIPMFERAGMDLLNVSAGVYESMDRIVPPASLGETPHVDIAAQLKQYATVPVCAVGSVFSLEKAASILASGSADLVAMGRAQVADPAIVIKSKQGRTSEINNCSFCNQCTFWVTGDSQMHCSINPKLKKAD